MLFKKLEFLKKSILLLTFTSLVVIEVNSKDFITLTKRAGSSEEIDLEKLNVMRIVNITSIEDIYINENDKNIKIYPNPTKDKIILKLQNIELFKSKEIEITIFNSTSQKISNLIYNLSEEIEINLKQMNLPKGIYFVNINDNNQLIKKSKFILE